MKRVAIIGGGMAGLSVAQLLKDRCEVTVYEREPSVGGLIRCKRIEGALFHLCGGHVFNTKNKQVNDWFWSRFDKNKEFLKAERRSAVCLDNGTFVDYPIEYHAYQLEEGLRNRIFSELTEMANRPQESYLSFGDFLLKRFGRTLYELYFKPYNEKIWRCDLDEIPMDWLSGKLPMPTPQEIISHNESHEKESEFVHSSFYYPKNGGSQFIANRLAEGLNVCTSSPVVLLEVVGSCCKVNGRTFDEVFFCGNVKELPAILRGVELGSLSENIARLSSHGTTSVFCEIDETPYSWFYQPTVQHRSHRVICTGNFSRSNNSSKMTCSVEFTDEIEEDVIRSQLKLMPYHPKYLTHNYTTCSYPVQHANTRATIDTLRAFLRNVHIRLVGRFAEWEYFNMDAVIASAMTQTKNL